MEFESARHLPFPSPRPMARKPNKKPRPPKRPSVSQRLNAQIRGGRGRPATRHQPDVRIDKAQDAWNQRRYDEAIRYYEQALARSPHNPVLLVDVARAYALRYRYADAERLIAVAQTLHPDDADLQQMLGRSYVQLEHFDRAIACYQRALELAPSSPERPQILLELADMHERLHQLDAARTCAEQALALAPRLEKARYALAVIDRRAGDAAAAEERWRQLVSAGQAAPGVIADSWYQLASLADSGGRYVEAFESLRRAKEIYARAAGPFRYDAADIARVGGRTFAALTPEHCQRWHAAAAALRRSPVHWLS